jgi:hypothetical protein
LVGGEEDHSEGAVVAVEVITVARSAEDSGGVDQPVDGRLRHELPDARDGVPDEEMPAAVIRVEEDAAMVAVEGPAEVGLEREWRLRGGEEAGLRFAFDDAAQLEVAEQGRRPVEGAVAAEEVGAGEEAEPGLADEGGADEALRLVRGGGSGGRSRRRRRR